MVQCSGPAGGDVVKKWIALASTLALLLLGSGLSGIPAEAASRDNDRVTVVYQGYTVSWSGSDPSEVRIERTPGRTEHSPRAASSKSVDLAKSRVAAQSSTSTVEGDSCTAVPDSFGSANFTPACAEHDRCYSADSSTDRLQCDQELLLRLRGACFDAYAMRPGLLLTCYAVAAIYYAGVRLFGSQYYVGGGSEA
jgi:hypothetical protein